MQDAAAPRGETGDGANRQTGAETQRSTARKPDGRDTRRRGRFRAGVTPHDRRCFGRVVTTRRRDDACDDAADRAGVFAGQPRPQVDGLVAPEAHWRFGAVERHRHQLVQVAAPRRFVEHPVRADRPLRPGDDDRVGTVDRRLDRLGEFRTAFDLRVPPHVDPRLPERRRETFRALLVAARVTQERRWTGRPCQRIRRARHREASPLPWPLAPTLPRPGAPMLTPRRRRRLPRPSAQPGSLRQPSRDHCLRYLPYQSRYRCIRSRR